MNNRWYRDVYRDAVWESADLKAVEKAVAETYARHARDVHGNKSAVADLAWLTYERLMEKAGVGRRAGVSSAVTRLVDLGWLKPVQQVSRRATVYRLTIPLGGSSDGGTTNEDEADQDRGSDGGTTVVPLSEPGSSAFSSRSSDGGTQPLGPSKELTTRSISLSDSAPEAAASDNAEPEPEREIVDASHEEPKTNPIHRMLIKHGCPADRVEQIKSRIDDIKNVLTDGWYFTADRNRSLGLVVDEALQDLANGVAAPAQHCDECDDTGETGDYLNRHPCGCLWWRDLPAARKGFKAQLKNFADCDHGVPGGDQKDPTGWQFCSQCRGPGWVDRNEQPRTGNRTPGQRRTDPAARDKTTYIRMTDSHHPSRDYSEGY